MKKTFVSIAIAAALAVPAFAQAQTETADDRWSGTGELGLAIAKGNTDTQTLVGKLAAERRFGNWNAAAGASFLRGEADGAETAYRYEVFAKGDRLLTERSYVTAGARMERDHYSSYEYQNVAALGYGFKAIANDTTNLTFEAGAGYRWSKYQGVRVHENEAVFRGSMLFDHSFNDNVKLYDNLLVEAGSSNTFIRNDLGVLVKMSDALALKAGLETRHNTDVLPGVKKTDTLTTLNVVYGF